VNFIRREFSEHAFQVERVAELSHPQTQEAHS
jgi:hypothetical protein